MLRKHSDSPSQIENLGNPGRVGFIPIPNPSLVHWHAPCLLPTEHGSLRCSPDLNVTSLGSVMKYCPLVAALVKIASCKPRSISRMRYMLRQCHRLISFHTTASRKLLLLVYLGCPIFAFDFSLKVMSHGWVHCA